MGEIRIVGPGKTRGYPYPVCKIEHYSSVCTGIIDRTDGRSHALFYLKSPQSYQW